MQTLPSTLAKKLFVRSGTTSEGHAEWVHQFEESGERRVEVCPQRVGNRFDFRSIKVVREKLRAKILSTGVFYSAGQKSADLGMHEKS